MMSPSMAAALPFEVRSKLLRLQDRYEEESELLREAGEAGARSAYLEERAAWHALPLFDRLVPRPPLILPKEENSAPSPATLAQLCFVTALGSDFPYFQVGIELIESLRHSPSYQDVPFCILDCGLTEESKQELMTRFGNLTIKDPGFDLEIEVSGTDFNGTPRSEAGMKGCLARPFIPRHFPGYRYYVWFDTDVWVHDERSLDLFITSAERTGVGSVVTPNGLEGAKFDGSWWHRMAVQHSLVPPAFVETLLPSRTISAGTFCIDAHTGFFDRWAEAMTEAVALCGEAWGPDELTYMYTRQRYFPETPVLEFRHNFAPTTHGLPIYHEGCLLAPYSAEPAGIIHFCGMKKDIWFAPLIESSEPVNVRHNKSGKGRRAMHSIHFRVWPWQDKPALRLELAALKNDHAIAWELREAIRLVID